MTSTVSSRASAAGLIAYLGTRDVETENGGKEKVNIPIADQNGITITTREGRAAVLSEWVSEFREAYTVNSVATLSIIFADDIDDTVLHDALNAAMGSRPFLYSRHPDGHVSVYAVTDLPARKLAGALRARGTGEGSTRAAENAEADFARRLADAGISASVRILGASVSEKSSRYFMEKFLRTEKGARTSAGETVKRGPSIKEQADTLWREWSGHIRSVEPRNAFHVIFSARAGTDAEAMKRAVRDFLGEQVAGHRWITAHHPETGHVHVHAMISARDDVGKALRFTKPELYEWREKFAAKAREHGIAMVATRRADVAATRPYSQAQVGAYERGRSDPRYLKTLTVSNRVERKRAGVVDGPSLTNGNLALASKWQAAAAVLRRVGARTLVIKAADRFAAAANVPTVSMLPAPGFVLLQVEVESGLDGATMVAAVRNATGASDQFVSVAGKTVNVLTPTTASVSKIEREIAREADAVELGGETQALTQALQARLIAQGLRAAVTVNAAGSSKDGAPSPWLQRRFEALSQDAIAPSPTTEFRTLVSDIKQQKEEAMPLSLEQFDERVARANKSMDRLETMVDSSGERQAVEEMRREISALFAEQRRDIELQQIPSAVKSGEAGGTSPATRADEARSPERATPPAADPAIVAQQQAIAAGRTARAVREQAGNAKQANEDRRQQALRQAEQERQRDNGRDGAER
ncbi:relaxase/mobilization nuclease domain-containing protein [Neorhizobium lilium]|uniref:relaxase/mobilization nuclease domain-containing protein n=1 Tax=Neorhizobium lilium TaxID=2503024 RepID=UPI0013E32F66|nr:relaxase/mobilization nuclease domain-containing protein [Neorhizobium lilium]